MKPASPVQTDRLLLRPSAVTDFDALLAIQSRADVARYHWDPRTAAEVRETLDTKVRATAIVAEGDNLSLRTLFTIALPRSGISPRSTEGGRGPQGPRWRQAS